MTQAIKEASFTQFFCPVADELDMVEIELNKLIQSLGIEHGQNIIDDIGDVPDKFLRSGIVLLAAKAAMQNQTKPVDSQIIKLAAIMELVHQAVYVHNRIDEQNRKSSDYNNSVNRIAVLVADSLYTRAFYEAARTLPDHIFQVISDLTQKMSLAQIKEELLNSSPISFKKYYEVIEGKTAVFFGKCCSLGAGLALAKDSEIKHFEEIGRNLGRIYQISADIANANQCLPFDLDLQEVNLFAMNANNSLSIIKDSIYKENLINLISYFSSLIIL